MSLNNLGNSQRDLGQREQALASTQEALELLWPFFEALPQAFSDRVGMILRNMRSHLEVLGRSPSQQLQERLAFYAAHSPRSSQYHPKYEPKSAWSLILAMALMVVALAFVARC